VSQRYGDCRCVSRPAAPAGCNRDYTYEDLIADEERNRQVTAEVSAALARGRNCLVRTDWTTHLETLTGALRGLGHDPAVLRSGMGARQPDAALARLQPQPGGPPLVVDCTAGADSFGSALFTRFDLTVLVAEPTRKGRLPSRARSACASAAATTTARMPPLAFLVDQL
jgi:hypothetical protein